MASPLSRFLDELVLHALIPSARERFGGIEEHPDPIEDPESSGDPDPENLHRVADYKEWERHQEVFRRERKVIALEITNPFSENCRRIRPQFEQLAKDFEGVPFVSVLTGPLPPLITTDRISQDVGPVTQHPAILLLYYDGPNHIKRKSYQGKHNIETALENGELKQKFKDFINERSLSEDESVKKQLCPQESDDVPSRAIPLKGVDDDLPHPVIFEEGKEDIKESDDDTDCKTSTTSTQYQSGLSQGASKTDDDDFIQTSTSPTFISQTSTSSILGTSYIIKKDDINMEDKIGQGRFGTVFKAKWKKRVVAVKSCLGNLLEQGGKEVEILASLPSHPNVLTFFGVAVSDDKISSLIVTELAAGGSLYARLHEKGNETPTADQSLGWAFQIASGMQHLHAHNIIHRDLKSPNVVLSLGYAKICDFGTARQLSKTYTYTKQAGSFRWMAPEIAGECEGKITNKCDVFSYGMILYEIYALKVPFDDIKSDVSVVIQVTEKKQRPSVPKDLPQFLAPLLQDCWSDEPEQRPSFKTIVMTIRTESYETENEQ